MIRQILQPCNHQSPSWPRPEGPSCGGRRGPKTLCITIPRHIHATILTVGSALCVPLHPDLHAKTGARQTISAQVTKSSSPRGRGLSPVSPAPASLRGAAAAQLQAPARTAQASNQSSILMQLTRFVCMPFFMRRPICRMLSRHTSCSMHMNSLRAGSPAPASPPRSPKLRRARPKPPTKAPHRCNSIDLHACPTLCAVRFGVCCITILHAHQKPQRWQHCARVAAAQLQAPARHAQAPKPSAPRGGGLRTRVPM